VGLAPAKDSEGWGREREGKTEGCGTRERRKARGWPLGDAGRRSDNKENLAYSSLGRRQAVDQSTLSNAGGAGRS